MDKKILHYEDLILDDAEDKPGGSIGLTKLVGKKIKEVRGWGFMDVGRPVLTVGAIEFEDGTFLDIERSSSGTDLVYLVCPEGSEQPNYDSKTLYRLMEEGGYEMDEDEDEDEDDMLIWGN